MNDVMYKYRLHVYERRRDTCLLRQQNRERRLDISGKLFLLCCILRGNKNQQKQCCLMSIRKKVEPIQ